MNRISYEPMRSIMMMCGGYLLVGGLPRALGVIGVKPGMEWVFILDATVFTVFLLALGVSAYAVYKNSQNITNTNK